MKYYFNGLHVTDDDGLCIIDTLIHPKFVSKEEMLKILDMIGGEQT